MTPDDMANFHEHMATYCAAEYVGNDGLLSETWNLLAKHHNEAFQYWCRQANPGPPEDT